MLHHRGLWFCTSCGFYCSFGLGSRSSPKKLLAPCLGAHQRTRAGYEILRRLAQRKPPKEGMDWPLPLGTPIPACSLAPRRRLRRKTTLRDGNTFCNFENPGFHAPDAHAQPPPDHEMAPDPEEELELGLSLPMGLDTDSGDDVDTPFHAAKP